MERWISGRRRPSFQDNRPLRLPTATHNRVSRRTIWPQPRDGRIPVNEETLKHDFERFAEQPVDVLEGALLVSRLIDPATDPAWCRQELTRLAACVGAPASASAVVGMLRTEGFTGAEDYYEARNSSLQFVLRERRGIPISLATVVIGVGERLAMEVSGINFPGHFLVTLERQFIDPYTLALVDDNERQQRLAGSGLSAQVAFRPADARDIVLRMLTNLRGLAAAQGNHAAALEYTDYQLLLTSDNYALRLIRAELWHGIGAPRMAGIELGHAIAAAPDRATKQQLEARLRQLAGERPTLH